MTRLIPLTVLLSLLGACTDTSSPTDTSGPDSADTADMADTSGPDSADTADSADTSSPDTAGPDSGDTTTDTSISDSSPADTDLGPVDPAVVPVVIDWAIQTHHSPESWFGWPTFTRLSDGNLLLAGQANRVVEFGERELDLGEGDAYSHSVAARVTPTGEVVDLRELCNRCLSGTTPLIPLSGGRYAFASAVDGEIVLAPGSAEEVVLQADHQLLVAVIGADGGLEKHALVARLGQSGETSAIAATADGGLVIGGSAWGLSVDGGPSFEVEEGWHYPGRAFLVVVDSELRTRYAEQLGGKAGSTIAMIQVSGRDLVTVGDFGGYPLGVESTFHTGSGESLTLTSVSSDDDPAMDLFVARWTLPELAAEAPTARPEVQWARRFANYQNGPRTPTWIRGTEAGGVEFRVDGAGSLVPDGQGQWALPRPDDYWTSVVLRVSADGEPTLGFVANGNVEPLDGGGYLSVAASWAGSTYRPLGDDGPSFEVPASTTGPDGVTRYGYIVAKWRSDGALIAAGMVVAESPTDSWLISLQGLVPQTDGSAFLIFHGSAATTFVTPDGARLALDREPNYERLVILDVVLDTP